MKRHATIVLLAVLAIAPRVARIAEAEESVQLTPRPGVSETIHLTVVAGAPASLLLFPGMTGVVAETPHNFLVRTRDRFAAAGFTTALFEAPSDRGSGMASDYRASAEHAQALAVGVAFLQQRSPAPVWLIGTSRGTVSAANGAARLGPDQVAGVVLTSSVWSGGMSYVPIGEIAMPVLLVHNRNDACADSPYGGSEPALASLRKAPVKELITVTSTETGRNPCSGRSPHGYYGIEDEVVGAITQWVKAHPPRQ